MKKRFDIPTLVILIVMACATVFVITYSTVAGAYEQYLAGVYGEMADSAKLYEIRAIVDEYFVGEYDEEQLRDGLAAGFIDGLGDKWSYYIPADSYDEYVESVNNAYVGVGVTVSQQDGGGYLIYNVTPGGPADSAGIQENDIMTAVDGQSVLDWDMDTLKAAVRGVEGTQVTLTVERTDALNRVSSLDITVTRASVDVQVVFPQLLEKENVAYIAIDNFDSGAAGDAIEAAEGYINAGAAGIVFDVRNNPGGLLTELLELLDYLLPEGDTFISRSKSGQERVYSSDADCVDVPIAVLVNENSYSAAEFFAAALQEYDWAVIVGEKTSGKGYSQQTFPLSDGSAIAISTNEYFTPGGVSLADTGVTPDIEVPVDDEEYALLYYGQLEHDKDTQLIQAVESVLERAGS